MDRLPGRKKSESLSCRVQVITAAKKEISSAKTPRPAGSQDFLPRETVPTRSDYDWTLSHLKGLAV